MSEALRLADALEQQFPIGTAQHYLDGEAAAELRRLHDLVEDGRFLLRRKQDEIAGLKTINAELVEALREIEWSNDTAWQRDRAKAALAKVGASNGS